MEKEIASRPQRNDNLDEDQAMAAFAQHLNDEDLDDPAVALKER